MSGEWMNHCFSQWEKTAHPLFSPVGAGVGALLGGAIGYTPLKSKGYAALGALSGAVVGASLPGGIRAERKERAEKEVQRGHFREARLARNAHLEKQLDAVPRHGSQEEWHAREDKVYKQHADLHYPASKLPVHERADFWRSKMAGQLIKAVATPVIGAGKMVGKRVAEKPISTAMGTYGAYRTAQGTIGTIRAARGDIQNAQNQHGTPTQAQHMGARQPRPNPARISQTGSY
jgi:hypothetical protein